MSFVALLNKFNSFVRGEMLSVQDKGCGCQSDRFRSAIGSSGHWMILDLRFVICDLQLSDAALSGFAPLDFAFFLSLATRQR
jgi:hypothetical protein